MARPTKCRRVSFVPGVTYFKPAGIPLHSLEEINLSFEEAEALRLKDIEGLDQTQGAVRMNISRPTFQRVLTSARRKMSDALLNGKAIRIDGGSFEYKPAPVQASGKDQVIPEKIAVVTDDGINVSGHFGSAGYYIVCTITDCKVQDKEKRDKPQFVKGRGLHQGGGECRQGNRGMRRGAGNANSLDNILDVISDCQVVIAGGIGWGAHATLQQVGIEVVITEFDNIDEAVSKYLESCLQNKKTD